jgi:hypothetical protein
VTLFYIRELDILPFYAQFTDNETVLQCECGGSAYTASEYRADSSRVISPTSQYERSRSSSRSSSEERTIAQFRKITTPVFDAMREQLVHLDFEDKDVLDLDKGRFDEDPHNAELLINNPDPRVRQVVEEMVSGTSRSASFSDEEDGQGEGSFSDEN